MIATGLSFEEYRAIPALNFSGMEELERSPAHYQAWLTRNNEEESDALRIGRLAHEAILEPEKFEARKRKFAIRPDGLPFNRKDGMKWRDDALAAGLTIVTENEHALLFGSIDRIKDHDTASIMLGDKRGRAEVVLVAEIDGTPVKCRVDWLPTGNTIVDLKTTEDASDEVFGSSIAKLWYHTQGAFYLDVARAAGLEMEHYCIMALEKKPPFAINCFQLDEDQLRVGRSRYMNPRKKFGRKSLLQRYADCAHANQWPGYDGGLKKAIMPDWSMKEVA